MGKSGLHQTAAKSRSSRTLRLYRADVASPTRPRVTNRADRTPRRHWVSCGADPAVACLVPQTLPSRWARLCRAAFEVSPNESQPKQPPRQELSPCSCLRLAVRPDPCKARGRFQSHGESQLKAETGRTARHPSAPRPAPHPPSAKTRLDPALLAGPLLILFCLEERSLIPALAGRARLTYLAPSGASGTGPGDSGHRTAGDSPPPPGHAALAAGKVAPRHPCARLGSPARCRGPARQTHSALPAPVPIAACRQDG